VSSGPSVAAQDTAAEIRELVDDLVGIAPWWSGWARPIDEAEIARFEAAHAVTLPAEHRAILLEVGDHAPLPDRPGGALAPLARARELSTVTSFLGPLAEPFPHSGSAAIELEWDDEADDYADPHWLRGCLPLTGAGCDQSYVLVVSGADRGRVWSVTPSGSPELHPTGLDFASWYRAELERGLERERSRLAELDALERRVAGGDLEAQAELGRALLYRDRARARELLERAWARAPDTPKLGRAIAELDLLEDRHDRIDDLAERDPPWGRCYAAIAATRRDDYARALELFAHDGHPATIGALVAGYHALALLGSGQPRRAIEVLRSGPASLANYALLARLRGQVGEVDEARETWRRVCLGLRDGPEPKPRPPTLADFIGLTPPSLAEAQAQAS
jgi:tetratricopeptide (TPR) repeat protein